jgi:hypothetical protein
MLRVEVACKRRLIFTDDIFTLFVDASIMFVMSRTRDIIWFLTKVLGSIMHRVFKSVKSRISLIKTWTRHKIIKFGKNGPMNNFLLLKSYFSAFTKRNACFLLSVSIYIRRNGVYIWSRSLTLVFCEIILGRISQITNSFRLS